MVSAKIFSYSVTAGETVADLQLRIEQDTSIPPANQELLLEAGLALESGGEALQCAVDYTVKPLLLQNSSIPRRTRRLIGDCVCVCVCVCRR